jgi:uncharacterized protein
MPYHLHPPHSFHTTRWAGGTTTELYIAPAGADFKQRNFQFRLSTATVEVEESVFSPLEGFNRTLLVLSGQITLHHQGHHSRALGSGEADRFYGGWHTSCLGTCVDFNLMTAPGTQGDLQAKKLAPGERWEFQPHPDVAHTFLYLFSGEIIANFQQEEVSMPEGHLLEIATDPVIPSFLIQSKAPSMLVLVTIGKEGVEGSLVN